MTDALRGFYVGQACRERTSGAKKSGRVCPTKKPRRLSRHELRVLDRTRLAMCFGQRVLSGKEALEFLSGRQSNAATWNRLCRQGYVKNTRTMPYVKLLKKGFDALAKRG